MAGVRVGGGGWGGGGGGVGEGVGFERTSRTPSGFATDLT